MMCSWHQSDVGSANIQDMASLLGKRLLPGSQEKMLIWNWIKCTSHYRQRERDSKTFLRLRCYAHFNTTRKTLVVVYKIGSSWYLIIVNLCHTAPASSSRRDCASSYRAPLSVEAASMILTSLLCRGKKRSYGSFT
ncbi:hypothetical protein DKX38_013160 [Salix brachista]|uniref:Uncharacterized protein n=1 Tax=Salix brachista TaxID=2182728 RepID=A0A5N5LR10_9ROSI|nr:hypothetical protein DKX38_013160 [Salix brachista]